MRHGRKSSAKTFHGFKEHMVVDLDSKVIRKVMVRPANEPEYAAVALLAKTLEQAPGLLQLDLDLGSMASPRIRQWVEQGVYIMARPWPCGGPLFTQQDFTFDFVHGTRCDTRRERLAYGRQVALPSPCFLLLHADPFSCARDTPSNCAKALFLEC